MHRQLAACQMSGFFWHACFVGQLVDAQQHMSCDAQLLACCHSAFCTAFHWTCGVMCSGLQVSKAVYASTTKTQLNLDKRRERESNPLVTYPDIAFAVENFEEAFESLVCSPLLPPGLAVCLDLYEYKALQGHFLAAAMHLQQPLQCPTKCCFQPCIAVMLVLQLTHLCM